MSAWPGTLPQQFSQDGYQEQLPDVVLRSEMDTGPAKVRRRYTAAVLTFQGQMEMDLDQVEDLEDFYADDCDYGATTFTWVHPRTGAAVTMRWVRPPTIQALPGGWAQATLVVEVLP